jgi:signal transduction histidine kinase
MTSADYMRMGPQALIVVSALFLVAAGVLDLAVWPDHNVPILYVVPVLLASFSELAALVVATSALAVLLDLLSTLISKPPLGLWPFTLFALLAVCYLALEVAGQRAVIRRQVEEAARAKWNELLLAEVAHELRTPLTVILGYAQVLRHNPKLPDALHGPVTLIEKSALQMRGKIDDLVHRWDPGGRNPD